MGGLLKYSRDPEGGIFSRRCPPQVRAFRAASCRVGSSQGLVPAATSYSFSDLIAFQTLIKLRENKIPIREIARALQSLREKLDWVKHPLSELRVVSDGKRIAVHVAGQKMEAISGQILFDFEAVGTGRPQEFSRSQAENQSHPRIRRLVSERPGTGRNRRACRGRRGRL